MEHETYTLSHGYNNCSLLIYYILILFYVHDCLHVFKSITVKIPRNHFIKIENNPLNNISVDSSGARAVIS